MRAARCFLTGCFAALLPAASAWASEGGGLTPNTEPWARWQGRLSLEVQAPLLRADLGAPQASGLQVRSVSLLRDYYLTRSLIGAGTEGGLRTTGGLIVSPGSRTAGQALFGTQPGPYTVSQRAATLGGDTPSSDGNAAVPYLGVGYIGLSSRGGWSFSADLGLVALAAGNVVKFGRVFSGTQSLDGLTREMRFAPVMQMGLTYSF
jgi:hypothetical protein